MTADQVESVELVLLFLSKILRVFKPDIASPGEFGMGLAFEAADLFDRIIDHADDVKFIEGDGGLGKVCGNAVEEGLGHVGADFGNGCGIAAVGCEVVSESGDGGGVFTGSGEQDLALFQVDEKGDIFLAAPGSGFINADLGDRGMIGPGAGRVHILVDDAPDCGVVLADRRAVASTGIDFTSISTSASNSSVKPLSGLAQETATR